MFLFKTFFSSIFTYANNLQAIPDEDQTQSLYAHHMASLDRPTTVGNVPHGLESRLQQLVPAPTGSNLQNIQVTTFTPNSLTTQSTSNRGNARSDVQNFSLDNPREFLTQYEAAPTEPWTAQSRFLGQDHGPPFKKRAVSQTQSERPCTRDVTGLVQRLPRNSDSGYMTGSFPPQSGLSNASYFSNQGSQCLSEERETIGDTNNEIYPEAEQTMEGTAQRRPPGNVKYQKNEANWAHQYSSPANRRSACLEDQLQSTFPVRVKSAIPKFHKFCVTANKSRHTRRHRPRQEKAFVCEVLNCVRGNKGFGTKNDLLRHKKCVHKIVPLNTSDKSYRCAGQNCPKPGKRWPRLDNFVQQWKRVHIDEDP